MRDLAREEELEKRISEKVEVCSEKKWMRVKRTFFVISGSLYLIMLYVFLKGGIKIGNIDIDSIFDILDLIEAILGIVFAPMFAAGFIMFISYGVLYYIIEGSMKEEKEVYKLLGELNAIKYSDK